MLSDNSVIACRPRGVEVGMYHYLIMPALMLFPESSAVGTSLPDQPVAIQQGISGLMTWDNSQAGGSAFS
jgi:hypothetical protein